MGEQRMTGTKDRQDLDVGADDVPFAEVFKDQRKPFRLLGASTFRRNAGVNPQRSKNPSKKPKPPPERNE